MAAARAGRPKGTGKGAAENASMIKWPDIELYREIEELAKIQERSVPSMVRFLCRQALAMRKGKTLTEVNEN